jgi:hypothetical protein
MEFKTEAQQAVYHKVEKYLRELFGEMAAASADRPKFIFRVGTSLTHIVVMPWSDDDAIVAVRAYVVSGAELTPDLLHYLLRENDTMLFGAFGIDGDNDIFFEHSIVGTTCDKEELRASVLAVGYTADKYDEEIVSRWGGLRAIEQMK